MLAGTALNLARHQQFGSHNKLAHSLASLLVGIAGSSSTEEDVEVWEALAEGAAILLQSESHRACVVVAHGLRQAAAIASPEVWPVASSCSVR